MIYKCYPPHELPDYDPSQGKTPYNQLPLKEGEDDPYNNQYQKVSYYFLSNNDYFDGWSNFIDEYHVKQEYADGYMRTVDIRTGEIHSLGF